VVVVCGVLAFVLALEPSVLYAVAFVLSVVGGGGGGGGGGIEEEEEEVV
jgi:hypothetical protein